MKVHLHIQNDQLETEIHIYAAEYNEAIEQLMKKIKTSAIDTIVGYSAVDMRILKPHEIYTIYSEEGRVFLQTDDDEFECKSKLYELEQRYETIFVRISKSTLVNISKISSIQSKMLSNPQLLLSNETSVSVSRNYFKPLKEKLGLGRDSE